jgi:general secretion pathway protein D
MKLKHFIVAFLCLLLVVGCSTTNQEESKPVKQDAKTAAKKETDKAQPVAGKEQPKQPVAAKEAAKTQPPAAVKKEQPKQPVAPVAVPKEQPKQPPVLAMKVQPQPVAPVVVPQPVKEQPAVAVKSPEEQKFDEKIAREKVREEQEALLVRNYLTTAQNYAREGKFEDAYQFVLEALKLNPTHPEALLLKKTYGGNLGYRPDEIASQLNEAEDYVKVKIEQTRLEIDNRLAEGKRLYNEKKYKQAITLFKQAKEILRWMPYYARELEGKARQLDSLMQKAEQENTQQEDELKRTRMAEAEEEAKRQEKARLKTLQEQVRILFRQANLAFERERYGAAESFCNQIARLDPENKEVFQLLELVRVAKHAKTAGDTRDRYMEEWKRAFEQVDNALAYQDEIVVWPSYEEWKKISKRGSKGIQEKATEESPYMRRLQEKLEEDITMDFTESPLSEVVDFIRNRTGINIIIDPQVYKDFPDAEALKVEITVNNLKLSMLLNLMLDMKGLSYHIDPAGGVLVISSKARIKDAPLLKLYNVRDLTGKLNDFPAQEITLTQTDKTGGSLTGVEVGKDEERPATTITEEQLMDLIKNNIAKGTWDRENRSIDTRHGTLIIRQASDVHKQIESLLNDLRKATGLLVTIETRFIQVSDDFLEDVGVDWRNLGAVHKGGTIGDISETSTAPPGLNASEIGTGHVFKEMDDAIFGDPTKTDRTIGTGKSAGFFWKEDNNVETKQRLENLFDQTLGSSSVITNKGGLSMQLAYIDDIELQAILQAVRKRQRSNLVRAPRLTVFNTQRANVSILQQIAYVKDYDVQVATNATIADPQVGTIQEGVVLDVRPIISSDRKYVTLELQPTVAELLETEQRRTELASSASSGSGEVVIELPRLQMTKIKTTVTIPDGGTLLLGGVIQGSRQDYMSGIPYLSDIPILQFLFSRKGKYSHRQSLLILVTAKITSMEGTEPTEGLNR